MKKKRILILLILIILVELVTLFIVRNIDNKNKNIKKEPKKEEKINKDNVDPEIKLIGADELTIVVNSEYIEKGAVATDNIDGDITSNIKIKNNINLKVPGDYEVIYTVEDSSKNKVKVSRKIKVINVDEKDTDGIPVLMYHYFYDDTIGESGKDSNYTAKSSFEEQLKYLKDNNYYFPTMREISMYVDGKLDLPAKSVVITMDDGQESNYRIAYPLALQYKIPMTMFVVTSWTNPNDELQKSMINSGYISMQSHSHDMHKSGCSEGHGGLMLCIDYNEGVEDLKKSKEILGNSDSFAYPCGDFNDSTIRMLSEAGFELAFTTNYGKVTRSQNKLSLPRVRINGGISLNQFINSL